MTSRAARIEAVVQVLILLFMGVMAGAASFVHIHDVTVAHGQPSWIGWANAIVIELMSIVAGLDIRRRKRTGQPTGFVLTVLLTAIGVSLAAQVAEAHPSVWGWTVAAVPALPARHETSPSRPTMIQQVREHIAAAKAAGRPEPGRPTLVRLTGVTDHQVGRALAVLAQDGQDHATSTIDDHPPPRTSHPAPAETADRTTASPAATTRGGAAPWVRVAGFAWTSRVTPGATVFLSDISRSLNSSPSSRGRRAATPVACTAGTSRRWAAWPMPPRTHRVPPGRAEGESGVRWGRSPRTTRQGRPGLYPGRPDPEDRRETLMNAVPITVETVLPRPVAPLPLPALTAATRKLADKLVDQFNMSDEGAHAFALAVVDPSDARRSAENPERLSVPGGVIIAVRTEVWSRYVIPDPRNPRIGPARRHPVSNVVGRGGESTRLRPLGEPKAAVGGRPELIQQIQSQEHLAWAAQQAREYIINNNDWRSSIRHQGVMTEVWLAATTFEHLDDNPSVTIPVTAEGSSRMTCVHDLLGLRSADIPYDRDERRMRAHIRRLNEEITAAGSPDQVDKDVAVKARCERVPALLLVGFEPHGDIAADFGVAVKSLVALRHVDYPKPWGPATENEALADAVVDELERRGLITARRAEWLSGVLTPKEADAAGFSADPAVRTAAIVRLFTDRDMRTHHAVRVAITSQSTRKNTSPKLLFELATSLVLRSVPEEDTRRRERIRKYLTEAFSNELAKENWDATSRGAEELAEAALAEVGAGNPGPATRELAARGAYPLVVRGHLLDRGPRDVEPEDRRKPGEVINRMRLAPQGVYQLRQALIDFGNGRLSRLVDGTGQVERNADGRDMVARNADLRRRFRAPGDGPGLVPAPETPAEILGNALNALGGSIREVEAAVKKVEAVQSDDGTSAIDSLGASKADCDAWQAVLFGVLQKLPIWSNRSTQRHGPPPQDDLDVDEDDDLDIDDDLDEDDLGPDAE